MSRKLLKTYYRLKIPAYLLVNCRSLFFFVRIDVHLHRKMIQTEDFGSLEANNIALKFLSVHWEVSRFDIQHSVTRITKHVFHVCVPSHRACTFFLKCNLFCLHRSIIVILQSSEWQ